MIRDTILAQKGTFTANYIFETLYDIDPHVTFYSVSFHLSALVYGGLVEQVGLNRWSQYEYRVAK